MNIIDELDAQYNDIDNEYSAIEFKAISKRWQKKESKYRRKRELNDQAYFLFMFSRLEDKIRNESSALIARKKKLLTSWKQRVAWDILPESSSDERFAFKNRLALLTQKGKKDYNLVISYYKERNSIAHGGSFTMAISMPTVISNFKRLYNEMKS